jgi:hypothetical protein
VHGVTFSHAIITFNSAQPEIIDQRVATAVQEDIRWRQITVDYPL